MQWQTNGELDQGDLIELVCHLRNVECQQHSDELSRLGQKHTELTQIAKTIQKQPPKSASSLQDSQSSHRCSVAVINIDHH
jgi:hypothetical protein